MESSLTINEAVKFARETFSPYPVKTMIDNDSIELDVMVDQYAVRIARMNPGHTLSRDEYLSLISDLRSRMRGIGAEFTGSRLN